YSAASGRDQWNTFTYERGNHVNHELVDLSFIEKRRNNSRATHHPDVLSLLPPQTSRECFDGFVDELYSRRKHRRQRTARKNIILNFGIKGRAAHASLLKVERHI